MEAGSGISAYSVFLILICVLGIIGNLMVIVIILVLKEYKKTVTHWYILQLAIADALFVTTIPFNVSQRMNDWWYFGDSACKFKEAMVFINYYASIMFLMVMCVDRYLAICHAFNTRIQNFRKPIVSYIIIVVVWIAAILLSTPIITFSLAGNIQGNCKCSTEFPPNSVDKCAMRSIVPNAVEFCKRLRQCKSRPTPDSSNSANSTKTFTGISPLEMLSVPLNPNGVLLPKQPDSPDSTTSVNNFTGPIPLGILPVALNPNKMPLPRQPGNNTPLSGLTIPGLNPSNPRLPLPPGLFPSSSMSECKVTDESPGWRGYVWFNFIVMFILPILVMSFCYGMITNKFWNTNINKARRSSSQQSAFRSNIKQSTKRKMSSCSVADRDRKRVTIMCAVLVATFILSWVLFHSVHIAKLYGVNISAEGCKTFTDVSIVLIFLNSALNPFLYSFLGTGCQRKWKMIRETSFVRQMTTSKTRSTNDGNKGRSVRSGSGCTNKMIIQEQLMNSKVNPETECTDENEKIAIQETKD